MNNYFDIESIASSVTSLFIPDWSCNDLHHAMFDFSRFSVIESIEIGNDCFGSVKTFEIKGLNRLKTIKIGNNSFTQTKNSSGKNESKSFYILNCESLESIQIGKYSFSDFAGDFELKNLPQLQSIQIGDTESDSYNFYSSFLEIDSISQLLISLCIRLSCSDYSLDRKIIIPEFSIASIFQFRLIANIDNWK